MNNQYPALTRFFGAYFHQDFLLDYGNADGAISAFLANEPHSSIRSAYAELEGVIPLVELMDDQAEFLWRALGCYYLPSSDGLSVVDWLKYVGNTLFEHVALRKKDPLT